VDEIQTCMLRDVKNGGQLKGGIDIGNRNAMCVSLKVLRVLPISIVGHQNVTIVKNWNFI
jgi:hypothetical protein